MVLTGAAVAAGPTALLVAGLAVARLRGAIVAVLDRGPFQMRFAVEWNDERWLLDATAPSYINTRSADYVAYAVGRPGSETRTQRRGLTRGLTHAITEDGARLGANRNPAAARGDLDTPF